MDTKAEGSRQAKPGGLAMALAGNLSRYRTLTALSFCIVAAFCATYLSGINFPEQNNRWQIPVVLDFAGSAEGPHDAYAHSFANFISLFWIAVRAVTTEANIQTMFVSIQIIGNILLACAIFALLRHVSRSALTSAFVTAFLCFCYGLWGATPFGYSEIFVTYATHTQYAATLCLFGIGLIIARRPFWAAALFGIAANVNLFMAFWGAMAAGLTLLFLDRRIGRDQIGFALIFLLLAGPVALWGLQASAGGNPVPLRFLHDFLAGHAYGFDYPRALVQTFALGIAAALAVRTALQDRAARHLGTAMLASMAVLAAGTLLPYLTDIQHAVLLHPLRFTSVVIPLTAICAGALFVDAWRKPAGDMLFPAAIALAGFMLKLPILSIFGFALAIPRESRALRMLGLLLSVASLLALFLPAPEVEISSKVAFAFVLTCLILAAVATLAPASAPLPARIIAALAGGVTVVPFSAMAGMAALLGAAAMLLCFAAPRWQRVAAATASLGCLILLFSIRDDMMRLGLVGFGILAIAFAPLLLKPVPHSGRVAKVGLAGLVLILMLLGLLNGAKDHFAPAPSPQQHDFLAAQRWAREHTPPDTMFLPVGVDDGFSLMSRRPVWWEESHAAAVLWQPAFYPLWSCRKAALASAVDGQDLVELSRRNGIAYIIASTGEAHRFAPALPAYRNAHYAILRVDGAPLAKKPGARPQPTCPDALARAAAE